MAIFSPQRKTSSGTEEVQFPISSINGLQTELDTFVDKTNAQTITGSKTFAGMHNFTGETKFTNSQYAPTFTDIANGIGKSSGFTRGAFMQAFVGQVIAPNANHTDETRGYSIESGKIKFQRITGTNSGQPTLTDLAVLSANGLTVLGKQVATVDQIPTDTGVTSVSVSGSGNAVTSASISGRALTLTKGASYVATTGDENIGGNKTFTSNVKAPNFNSRFAIQSVPYGTAIGSNADLNTTTYLKVGNYYCSANATAGTLKNCPTGNAFMMTVYSPLVTAVDNETTSSWVYRVRKLMTHTGEEYIQSVNSGNTAGTFTYGAWKKIAKTTDIPSITATAGANINSVGTPSVTASTSNGVTTLTFNYLKGATGVGISSITITEA